MSLFPAAFAALTLTMLPQAQLTGEALLEELLARVEQAVQSDHGVTLVEEVGGMHQLALGEIGDLVFDLEGGNYMIVAVCDEACSDIDIVLSSVGGELIGEDTLDDDTPVVTFEAAAGAGLHARIAMAGCRAEKCRTRARVYQMR
jgi:hypothetical protein